MKNANSEGYSLIIWQNLQQILTTYFPKTKNNKPTMMKELINQSSKQSLSH